VSNISQIDTSQVSQLVVEKCKLVGGLNCALTALYETRELNRTVKPLMCPTCSFPHLDTKATCHSLDNISMCRNPTCRKQYKNSSGAFGNPLAAYDIVNTASGAALVVKTKAQLQHTHRTAHGEQGHSD
jgi:hypothetical protein